MNYNIRGKNIEVTKAIKDYIIDKLDRLDKYFSNKVDVKVLISAKGNNQKVEVTIIYGKYTIRAEESKSDLYSAIDLVGDKIERQIKKYKTKIISKKKRSLKEDTEEYISEEVEDKIARRKEVYLKPIDEEEAIVEMELLDHSFFVYKDDKTNKINVIYKRADGGYGIIEAN